MEWCSSWETCFHKEELCDDKNVPTICNIHTKERSSLNQSERNIHTSDTVLKNGEENGIDQITGILKQYYEGEPLFYSNKPRKAKVFTPILLYHSYSNNDSNENSCDKNLQNLSKPDGAHLIPDDSQYRHLKITLSEADTQDCAETSMLETDEMIQKNIAKETNNSSRWTLSNVFHNIHNEVVSTPCDVHSEETLVKSEFIQKPTTSTNDNLQHGCHRSAFSKPRRFQDCGLDYSHAPDTYVDSLAELQRTAHNSPRDLCDFQCFPLGHPVYFNSHDYQNVNIQSFTLTSCPDFLPRRFAQCMCENCLGDISHHPLYSELNTHQLPFFSHSYNSDHYQFLKLNPRLLPNQILDVPFKIPDSLKTQDSCIRYPQHLWRSDNTRDALPKNPQKVHPVEKPHKCECGRAFARHEELTRHRRIHSGHRPFRCSVCAKTFGRKDHLKKHRTTHLHISEKKVHVCNIKDCQQRYTRSDALARHQWAIHGIKASIPK